MIHGLVFDIQRFAIHDGHGIRTTVFLKGCPLHCLWCHNPEGQTTHAEIFFLPEKCITCHYCEQVCANDCHHFEAVTSTADPVHRYDRSKCIRCGQCTRECYSEALEICGKEMSVEAVMEVVLKDHLFYQTSGGGLTLSGGEPMQQFEFTLALLQSARQSGLHTCLETSGFSSEQRYIKIMPFVNLFYYDIKETDPEYHRVYTGAPIALILENLKALDQVGASIVLRCPIVPGINDRDDHFQSIAQIANQMQRSTGIHILPYHDLGASKSQRLGKTPPLNSIPLPDAVQIQGWVNKIQQYTHVRVQRD